MKTEAPLDPIRWLASQPGPRGLWWDLESGRYYAGAGVAEELRVEAPASTTEIERAIRARAAETEGPGWLGGVRFSPERAPSAAWARYGAAWAFLPRAWVFGDDEGCVHGGYPVAPTRLRRETEAPAARVTDDDGEAYAARVARGVEAIRAGLVEKVVLARELAAPASSPEAALSALARAEQKGTAFWLEPRPGEGFFGVTPERLYAREGARFVVDALAGTAPVTGDRAVDDAAAAALLDDDKERREHAFVADAITRALSPLSRELRVSDAPGVRRLARVQHLHAVVEGELREARPLLSALHPTPAVCGTPRAAAYALIDELEPFDRGLYAGAVGRFHADGESLSVALRCARYDAAGLTLYAGAGVVAGSVPERERAEVARKASGLQAALRGASSKEDAA